MITQPSSDHLRIIGHRGAPTLATENTLDSFRAASDLGLTEIEFDIRLSRDGVPVVIHDASLKRTHGLTTRVAHTRAKDLVSHGVPTLEQAVELLDQLKLHATVEIKACSPGSVGYIAKMAKSLDLTVSSFDINWIIQAAKAQDGLSVQWTVEKLSQFHPLVIPAIVSRKRVREIAADIRHLTQDGVARARSLGLDVLVYTVKTRQQLEKAQRLGVDGVFVDDSISVRQWMK